MSRNDPKFQQLHAAEGLEMIAAMRQGVVEALEEHKKAGRSVVTWDRATGEIVHLRPDEIIVPEAESRQSSSST